jgi:hypothetical protein
LQTLFIILSKTIKKNQIWHCGTEALCVCVVVHTQKTNFFAPALSFFKGWRAVSMRYRARACDCPPTASLSRFVFVNRPPNFFKAGSQLLVASLHPLAWGKKFFYQ